MPNSARIIFAILLLSAVLRLYGLSSESLWLDEGHTARRATDSLYQLMVESTYQTETPLYFVMEKIWCAVFGTSEFSLRFPSVVFGIGAVFGIFLLACEIFSVDVGLLSALLLAINPFAIHYSQEARPYALLLFASVFSFYFLLRVMRNLQWPVISGYLFFTVLAMYSHPLGPLVLIVHGAAFLIFRRHDVYYAVNRKPLAVILTMTVTLMIYMPQLILMWRTIFRKVEGSSPAGWIPIPSFMAFVQTIHEYFMSPFLAIAAIAIIVLGFLFGMATRGKTRRSFLLLASIIGGFLITPWLISHVLTPIFVVRCTFPALIALIILLACALTKFSVSLRMVVLGILFTLTAHTLYGYYTKLDKAPWRETAQLVREQANPGDMVVLNASYTKDVFNYYFLSHEGVTVTAPWTVDEIPASLYSAKRVWLIQAYGPTPLNVANELMTRIAENHMACEQIDMEGWADPNPWAFWIADIQVTRFETKDNGIN
jgi:uncharacterized membrane protein